MRKLAWIGALAAALAWTGARADDAQKKQAEAQNEVNKAKADASKDVSEAKAEANKDVSKAQADANKKVSEAEKDAQKKEADARHDTYKHDAKGDDRKHPMFGSKDNFEVKGRIASVSSGSITVTRDDLPAAKLNVDANTRIELDGDRVSASALKPGEDVKASFNLANDKPMAVEIKAKKSDHADRTATPGNQAADRKGMDRDSASRNATDRNTTDRNLADPNAGTTNK